MEQEISAFSTRTLSGLRGFIDRLAPPLSPEDALPATERNAWMKYCHEGALDVLEMVRNTSGADSAAGAVTLRQFESACAVEAEGKSFFKKGIFRHEGMTVKCDDDGIRVAFDRDHYLDRAYPNRNKAGENKALLRFQAEGEMSHWTEAYRQARKTRVRNALNVGANSAHMAVDGVLVAIGGDPIAMMKNMIKDAAGLTRSMVQWNEVSNRTMRDMGRQAEAASTGEDHPEEQAHSGPTR
jgi:hypothetical protein